MAASQKRLIPILLATLVVVSGCAQFLPEEEISQENREALELAQDQMEDLGGTEVEFSFRDQIQCADVEAELTTLNNPGQTGVDARVDLRNELIDCTEDLAGNRDFVQNFTAGLNAGFGGVAEISLEEAECTLRHLLAESENPGRAIADGTNPADVEVFLDGAEKCFDNGSLAVMRQDEGSGPQNVGDDERLDGLAADCVAGLETACDVLFFASAEGSEYHDIGLTCDGRGDGIAYCTPGLETDETGTILASSTAKGTLVSECRANLMTSCDLLFRTAEIGSADEQFGFTCGNRIAVGGLPDCRTRFP